MTNQPPQKPKRKWNLVKKLKAKDSIDVWSEAIEIIITKKVFAKSEMDSSITLADLDREGEDGDSSEVKTRSLASV
jgi:hypothetical protein